MSGRVCSIDECGKDLYCKGFCKMHYVRLQRHGDPFTVKKTGPEYGSTPPHQFYEKALAYEGNECLFWPHSRNTKGYGLIAKDGRKNFRVHRGICESANGPPPTPEHQAAHSCGKGHLGCVAKRHLSWKTGTENQADRLLHGTDNRGQKNGRAKISEADAREIISLKGKEYQRETAQRFGITLCTVSEIQRGKSWNWLHADNPGPRLDAENAL